MSKKKSTRANNGMGSIRQRPSGLWEARYTSPDGQQRSVYAKSEGEITKKLKAILRDIDTGSWMQPSKMTMGEWLDVWLSDYQGHTSGRTLETYQGVVRRHFKPSFGNVKLANFSQLHVRRMVSDMTKRGLSPATIKHAHGILSTAVKCAIEAGLMKNNPVQGVRSPRMVKPQFTVIDRDMFQSFIDAAQTTNAGDALIFMLMTGLRVGEMRGLKWTDIDLDAKTMRIERQLHAPTRQHRTFGLPKDGEVREIQLPQEVVDFLKRHRKQQLEQRIAAGAKWQDDEISCDLVFRAADGYSLDESAIHYAITVIRSKINMPKLRPHDLRHSYAVAALRSGIDVKTVQHNLGHKHASITLDTYAAYTTDAGKTGAARFDEYWKKAVNTPVKTPD